MKRKLISKIFAGALIFSHLVLVACQENPLSNDNEAPSLPPAESMKVDLSLFTGKIGAAKTAAEVAGGKNFNNAALRALLINGVVLVVMALPVATLAAAASQKPQLGQDGKFHWIFNYQDSTITLQADLAGWVDLTNKESAWEMRVTNSKSNPPLEKFLWYSGRAALDNGSGFWDIYDAQQPDSASKVLRIDWSYTSTTQASLTFTVVKANVSENGDTVSYSVDGNSQKMTYFDSSKNTTVEIGWDMQTGSGYLIAPDYNNGAKACWDGQKQDVACAGD